MCFLARDVRDARDVRIKSYHETCAMRQGTSPLENLCCEWLVSCRSEPITASYKKPVSRVISVRQIFFLVVLICGGLY